MRFVLKNEAVPKSITFRWFEAVTIKFSGYFQNL